MNFFKVFHLTALLVLPFLLISVNGQISTPCTASMISSFTPCINYVTGSSANGTSPTSTCCSTLKTLMSTSMDCTCLVLTANIPVQLPFNRTLALSLPRACNMDGVPIQCKASGSPLPAPGPVLFAPPPPATASSPLSPGASKAVATAPSPESEATPLTPASPPASAEAPSKPAGIRPVMLPSSTVLSYACPPAYLLMLVAIMVLKSY
ncbi:hypothetical protein K2173_018357 [Erythroxylum novogranatense]|uniref:Bifunctional inhibitor/plant lipid transfer protein/seed storage helical domain-containing protein n=1 Tax=Erythroxylum novogranatense TaxID=1862640 RepID=A0AAV8UCU4_9ROSI|nr:hypothetical protein K2173_018357 [Erythroxylum novogranatense]